MPTPPYPDCTSGEIVPILSGLPTEQGREILQRGEAVLGGCVIADADPQWVCRGRGGRFRVPTR